MPSGMRILRPTRKSWYFVVSVWPAGVVDDGAEPVVEAAEEADVRGEAVGDERGRVRLEPDRSLGAGRQRVRRQRPPSSVHLSVAEQRRAADADLAARSVRRLRLRRHPAPSPASPWRASSRRLPRHPPATAAVPPSACLPRRRRPARRRLLVAARLVALGRGVRQRRLAPPTSWRGVLCFLAALLLLRLGRQRHEEDHQRDHERERTGDPVPPGEACGQFRSSRQRQYSYRTSG